MFNIVAVVALGVAMLFVVGAFLVVSRENKELRKSNSDLMDRLMARDFRQYVDKKLVDTMVGPAAKPVNPAEFDEPLAEGSVE